MAEQAAGQTPASTSTPAAAPVEAAKPAAKSTPKQKRYAVSGAVAVIRTTDGSERYLYRNAPVDLDAFDKESIKHLVSIGLVSEVK